MSDPINLVLFFMIVAHAERAQVPPVVRRLRRWMYAGVPIALGLRYMGLEGWDSWVATVAAVAIIGIVTLLEDRLKSRVRRAGLWVCPECGGSLHRDGVCSECGRAFDDAALGAAWARVVQ